MNKTANKQVICQVLMEKAKTDKDIVVLCSDSRGSASMTPFADGFPEQFVEVGYCGTKSGEHFRWAGKVRKEGLCSIPCLFPVHQKLRAGQGGCVIFQYECKTDRHQRRHQLRRSWHEPSFGPGHRRHVRGPNMRVYIPSDRNQTKCLTEALHEGMKNRPISGWEEMRWRMSMKRETVLLKWIRPLW